MNGEKTVIFDFDGTLADSVELIVSLYNEHVPEFGYDPIEPEEFATLRRMSYAKAMRAKRIKFYQVPKIVMKLGREMKSRMDEVKPYPGIVKVLNELRSSGYHIGVLTSNELSIVKTFFDDHGFPAFDFVVSEKTLFGKEKAMKKIFKIYGINARDVVYVGDEARDVNASNKAKVKVVGVTWGLGGKEGFEKSPPDVTVESVDKLFAGIVSNFNN